MDEEILAKLERFFQVFQKVTFKNREIIARPGDVFTHIYFVKSGYVRQYIITKTGQEVTLNVFKPLFYFTFLFSYLDQENKYYFQAITPLTLFRAPKEVFIKFLRDNPDIYMDMARNVFNGFNDLLINVGYLLSGDAYTKVAAQIMLLAKRFGEPVDGRIKVKLSPTHQELSTFLGVSRETVSLQMEKLQKMGVLEKISGFIFINKPEELQRIADGETA